MKSVSVFVNVEFDDGTEKEVELYVDIGSSGIGSYEFWGQKCHDKGHPCIDDIDFNNSGLTPSETKQIEKMIHNNAFDSDIQKEIETIKYNEKYGNC